MKNNILTFPIEELAACPLQDSAELLKLTLRAAGAGTWALDLVSGESYWSDEIFALFGVQRAGIVPGYDAWLALVHPDDRERARAGMDEAVLEHRPFEIEFRCLPAGGDIRWLKSKGNAVYGRSGAPLRMVGITFDFTQRKATEERLRFREHQLAAIADGVPALISYVDARQRYQYNNRQYEKWFGIGRDQLVGREVRDVVGEAAYGALRPHLEAALRGEQVKFSSRVDYKGVGPRDVEVQYRPHQDEDGEVLGAFVLVNDVSEYRDIERQLRDKQQLMEQLIETSSAAISVKDLQGRYLLANPQARRILGFATGRVPGSRDRDLLPPHVAAEREARDEQVLRTSTALESVETIADADGLRRTYISVRFPLLDKQHAAMAVCEVATDITEREAAQADLRASNLRFALAFDAAPCGMVILGLDDARLIAVNGAFSRITGFGSEDLVNRTLAEAGFWAAADLERVRASWQEAAPLRNEAFTCRAKGGGRLELALSSAVIHLGGQPCVLVAIRDDTACREAERALRMSEDAARARAEEMKAILDDSPAIVWIATDEECTTIAGSRAARDIMGMPEGSNFSKSGPERDGLGHVRLFHGDQELAPAEMPMQRAARGESVKDYEVRLSFGDGREVHLFGSAVPLRDSKGGSRGAIGAFVDVSPLKAVEAALLEADRRKDRFIAVIGHELRSPLAAIRAAATLMQGDVPRDVMDKIAGIVERQSQQMLRLADDLLDVSRVRLGKIELRRRRVEVSEFVGRAVEASQPLLDAGRHPLAVRSPQSRLHVLGDAVRLSQALSNLINNAARYSPAGSPVELGVVRQDREILITVRDEGIGFDAETRQRLFHLFSQSESAGGRQQGGLGIGLALAKELVELHGGSVDARSAGPGKGSEFEIRLPLVSE